MHLKCDQMDTVKYQTSNVLPTLPMFQDHILTGSESVSVNNQIDPICLVCTSWSEWTDCFGGCDPGSGTRTRTRKSLGNDACPYLVDRVKCNRTCGGNKVNTFCFLYSLYFFAILYWYS